MIAIKPMHSISMASIPHHERPKREAEREQEQQP
jgi:hypothetical protein